MAVGNGGAVMLRPAIVEAGGRGEGRASWLGRVARTLTAVTPAHSASIIGLFIISQAALLGAMILPWKLLIVLSRGSFPATLPDILRRIDPELLVIVLGGGAFLAFALHILSETLIGLVARDGARRILARHDKTGLFDGYRRFGEKFYQNYLRSFAAALASLIILILLAAIYPLLLAATLSWILLGIGALLGWRRLNIIPERQPSAVLLQRAWWGGGFLYMLLWIIADHWRGTQLDLTPAFLGLLIARQLLMFVAQIFLTCSSLLSQKSKVATLFLEEATWIPKKRALDAFPTLLTPEIRERWLPALLRKHCTPDAEFGAVAWRSAQTGKVLYGIVEWTGGGTSGACLIKLHHRQLDALGAHEKDILAVSGADWPSPQLIGEDQVESHGCLIFAWEQGQGWLKSDERSRALRALRQKLLRAGLPESLVARYDRTHPRLAQRLADIDWELIETLAPDDNARRQCQVVRQGWDELIASIDRLPRHLVLPDLRGRMMGSNGQGEAVICNWTRWRWEPVGAGWPHEDYATGQLADLLEGAAAVRPELADVACQQAYLAALLFDFDKSLAATDLTKLLELVARLHDYMALLSVAEPAATPQDMGDFLRC